MAVADRPFAIRPLNPEHLPWAVFINNQFMQTSDVAASIATSAERWQAHEIVLATADNSAALRSWVEAHQPVVTEHFAVNEAWCQLVWLSNASDTACANQSQRAS